MEAIDPLSTRYGDAKDAGVPGTGYLICNVTREGTATKSPLGWDGVTRGVRAAYPTAASDGVNRGVGATDSTTVSDGVPIDTMGGSTVAIGRDSGAY